MQGYRSSIPIRKFGEPICGDYLHLLSSSKSPRAVITKEILPKKTFLQIGEQRHLPQMQLMQSSTMEGKGTKRNSILQLISDLLKISFEFYFGKLKLWIRTAG